MAAALFGDANLVNRAGVKTSASALDADLVGIYFSAHVSSSTGIR